MEEKETNFLIDTHCHLNTEQFAGDLQETIDRAIEHRVKMMIVVGFDRQTINRAIELAEMYPFIYFTAAWHPVDAIECTEEDRRFLQSVWSHPKMVAIGETGLDYHWDKSPKDVQQELFRWHLEQAILLGKPFMIHDRDAHGDVYEILSEMYASYGELTGIMHSYSGSKEMAKRFIDLGLHLSISGVVTFKNAKNVKETVPIIPDDKLLIETDSPYLTPTPNRGKRNEPSYVRYVAQEIAKLNDVSYTTVMQRTTENARKLFNI